MENSGWKSWSGTQIWGYALMALMVCSACIYRGAARYRPNPAEPVVAKLSAADCKLPSAVKGQTLSEVQLAMVHGLEDFKLAVTNSKGWGLEIRNHWQEGDTHLFALRKKQRAWMYRLPDEQGEGGKVEIFIKVNGPTFEPGQPPKGELAGRCKLSLVEGYTFQPRPGVDTGATMAGNGTTHRSCAIGDTRECVGSGACRGGQMCLADGSGYGKCDCGAPPGDPGPETPDTASDGQ